MNLHQADGFLTIILAARTGDVLVVELGDEALSVVVAGVGFSRWTTDLKD
jgi:hypothetical protein